MLILIKLALRTYLVMFLCITCLFSDDNDYNANVTWYLLTNKVVARNSQRFPRKFRITWLRVVCE